MKQEDWAAAAELLRNVDRQALRRKYRDAEELYLRACREAGIEAYPEEETAETPAPASTPGPEEETSEPDPFLVTEDEQP